MKSPQHLRSPETPSVRKQNIHPEMLAVPGSTGQSSKDLCLGVEEIAVNIERLAFKGLKERTLFTHV